MSNPERLSKEEFISAMQASRVPMQPEEAASVLDKDEARKAKQREYNRRYAERKKAEKAAQKVAQAEESAKPVPEVESEVAPEETLAVTMGDKAMPLSRMLISSDMAQIKPTCVLTKDEAYAVAEFIDQNLFDAIRNDTDWDSLYALRNLIHAYEKMCMASGFVGLTEPEPERIEE